MKNNDIQYIRSKNGFIIDMDGVLYHGNKLLPGVRDFVNWLKEEKKKFVFLTNIDLKGRWPDKWAGEWFGW